MTGQAHWFTPLTIVLGGAAVVFIIEWLSRSKSSLLRQHDRIICPICHQTARCTFDEDARTGKVVKLVHCSLHAGRECPQECVKRINQGETLHPLN